MKNQCLPFLTTVLLLIVISCSKKEQNIDTIGLSFDIVQAAVDSAKDGEVVRLPAGTATWDQTLIFPDNKTIILMGNGPDETIISGTINAPRSLINMGKSRSCISNIGFKLSNDNGDGISVGGKGWRIDNCKFENLISETIEGVVVWGPAMDNGCPVGIVDHCEFINARVLVVGDAALLAHEIWAEPLGLGTNNALFVEDCIFNFKKFGNAIDANYGGRYVFRYNNLTDVYIEAHSVQGNNRAARSWEIYHNIISQKELSMWTPFFIRGGTGVIFNNEILGSWSSPTITVDNRRSFETFDVSGTCDGTSLWDGNIEANGYPARDQIGRSTDTWLWTEENPYPPQELSPFYQWNNSFNGSQIEVYVHNNCGTHIKENRDFYNFTAMLGYSPYIYPHPLITEWEKLKVN